MRHLGNYVIRLAKMVSLSHPPTPMSPIIRFDLPSAAPQVDHPREERREVGVPERHTWTL